MDSISRPDELAYLLKLLLSDNPEFAFIRGRRRIGKSWLLQELSAQAVNRSIPVLMHSGSADADSSEAMVLFINAFEKASRANKLSLIRKSALNWKMIFDEIINWSRAEMNLGRSVLIIIDEVQWISAGKRGFVGILKDAWVEFERETKAKIIICGSSERFFSEMTGGEEKILRGIATTAALLVPPFSQMQLSKMVPNIANKRQLLFLQMISGGIPYYIAAVSKNTNLGFYNAVNLAFFSQSSRLIHENTEMLGLEFRKNRQTTASLILMHICIAGRSLTISELAKRIGATISTIQDVAEKLIEYNIIVPKINLSKSVKTSEYKFSQGTTLSIKDSFLYFYYKVMKPLKSRIENNDGRENLFLSICQNEYIQGFSGYAFENLLFRFISDSKNIQIQNKLGMTLNSVYFIGSGYLKIHPGRGRTSLDIQNQISQHEKTKSQIDVIVRGDDNLVRVIDCKWAQEERMSDLDDVIDKRIELTDGETRMNVLALGIEPSQAFRLKAQSMNIVLIELEDFFN